ncbi:MAG: cytochrome c oxidase assembly protein [Ferrimicrobium sp.]
MFLASVTVHGFVGYLTSNWLMDWYAVVLFVLPVVAYWRGHLRTVRTTKDRSRLATLERHAIYMVIANVLMTIGFFSPLAWWAMVYQWVHMIWHLDLMVAAAPFVVLADPWEEIRTGMPRLLDRWGTALYRRASAIPIFEHLGNLFASPWTAVVFFDVAMWGWHLPGPFDWAMASFARMDFMMVCFFVSGVMMWYAVLDNNPNRYHEGAISRVGHMFLVSMSCMVLAIFLGLSNGAWYMAYLPLMGKMRTLPLLADQQIAAGILWVFGAVPWFLAGVVVLRDWLSDEEDGDLKMTEFIRNKGVQRARNVR